MNLDAGTRTRILVDLTLDLDPDGTTVELRVDDTWHAATWLDTAAETTRNGKTTWTQTARTTDYFAGPDAVASGATVLALGRHEQEVRVTSGQDVITRDLRAINVQ